MRTAVIPTPFQQGKYDGLCGFYSVLNAFRWLESLSFEPFGLPSNDQLFFNEALGLLTKVRGASLRLIRGDEGFTEPKLAALSRQLIATYHLPLSVRTVSKMRPLPSSFSNLSEAAHQIAGTKPFALVTSCDRGGHWTVYGANGLEKVRIDSAVGYRTGVIDGRTTRHFDHEEGLILSLCNGA